MRHQFSAMDRRRSELVNSIINEWERASLNYRIGRIAKASGRDDSHLALFMYGGKMLLQIIPPFRPVFWRLIYLPISHSTNGLLQRKNDGKIHDDGWEIYWKFCFFAPTSPVSGALLSKRFSEKKVWRRNPAKADESSEREFSRKIVHAQLQFRLIWCWNFSFCYLLSNVAIFVLKSVTTLITSALSVSWETSAKHILSHSLSLEFHRTRIAKPTHARARAF